MHYEFRPMRFIAVIPSSRTRHAELLRLCARIGYSPPRLGSRAGNPAG